MSPNLAGILVPRQDGPGAVSEAPLSSSVQWGEQQGLQELSHGARAQDKELLAQRPARSRDLVGALMRGKWDPAGQGGLEAGVFRSESGSAGSARLA